MDTTPERALPDFLDSVHDDPAHTRPPAIHPDVTLVYVRVRPTGCRRVSPPYSSSPSRPAPRPRSRLNFAAILLQNKTHVKLRLALPVEHERHAGLEPLARTREHAPRRMEQKDR